MSDMDTGGPVRGTGPETVRETETVRQTVRETGPGTLHEPVREPAGPPARGSGGTNLLLMGLVVIVLGLVAWFVMNRGNGGGDVDVDVNVPSVETPDVEVKESGK
ncbi:MAG TPA: hypothetical protein VLK84_13150 [Longimicrobium sp.]|nr:hypothetical protein [Longimicrobium sp.]